MAPKWWSLHQHFYLHWYFCPRLCSHFSLALTVDITAETSLYTIAYYSYTSITHYTAITHYTMHKLDSFVIFLCIFGAFLFTLCYLCCRNLLCHFIIIFFFFARVQTNFEANLQSNCCANFVIIYVVHYFIADKKTTKKTHTILSQFCTTFCIMLHVTYMHLHFHMQFEVHIRYT